MDDSGKSGLARSGVGGDGGPPRSQIGEPGSAGPGNSPGCPSRRSRGGRKPRTCPRLPRAGARARAAGVRAPGWLLPRRPWLRPARSPGPGPGAPGPAAALAGPLAQVPPRPPRQRAAPPRCIPRRPPCWGRALGLPEAAGDNSTKFPARGGAGTREPVQSARTTRPGGGERPQLPSLRTRCTGASAPDRSPVPNAREPCLLSSPSRARRGARAA